MNEEPEDNWCRFKKQKTRKVDINKDKEDEDLSDQKNWFWGLHLVEPTYIGQPNHLTKTKNVEMSRM